MSGVRWRWGARRRSRTSDAWHGGLQGSASSAPPSKNQRSQGQFTFLTTSAHSVVKPVHAKAMPILLLTDVDIETSLTAPTDEALRLQKPAPDDAVIVLPEEKKAA